MDYIDLINIIEGLGVKTIDHKILGKLLVHIYFEHQDKMERNLFILGCVFPDINPFTYIKGSIKYQILQGHNYLNAQNSVKRYMNKLTVSAFDSPWNYYDLGKLIHYITDAFTFPHNIQFRNSIKAHLEYENRLHKILIKKVTTGYFQEREFEECTKSTLFDFFVGTHQEYIGKRRCVEDDLIYIEKILVMTMISIMNRGEKHE